MIEPTYTVELTRPEIELLRMTVDEMAKFFFGGRDYLEGRRVYSYERYEHWRELAQADTKLFEALPVQVQKALVAEREQSEGVGE